MTTDDRTTNDRQPTNDGETEDTMTDINKSQISSETQRRIDGFAREQSRHYLDRAGMTYWEKLGDKVERTRGKAGRKLARLRLRSPQSLDSEADLSAYMGDFIADLMAQGLSEEQAFQQATAELAYDSGSEESDDLADLYRQRFLEAWEQDWDGGLPPGAGYGLYYSGCSLVGLVTGAAAGFYTGLVCFSGWLWLAAAVGGLAGAVLGIGCAMLLHARALR